MRDRPFGVRFPLTREVVISKHSTIHEPGIFIQRGRERVFEMVYGYPKTPLLRQMESGVLYFVARGNTHGKGYGIESELSQNR